MAAAAFDGAITWVGHGTFLLEIGTVRVLIDAFVESCPTTPDELKGEGLGALDLILLTHGHVDHVADAVAHQQRTGATVCTTPEVAAWLTQQGMDAEHIVDFNKGGTIEQRGIRITMVHAEHTSSMPDGSAGGEPVGFVLDLPSDFTIYASGDTTVFGDMNLIGRIHHPDLAILSIGDHYTMGPKLAHTAVELIGAKHVIGGHWGTFPPLVGRPQTLRESVATLGVHVHCLEPGERVTGEQIFQAGR